MPDVRLPLSLIAACLLFVSPAALAKPKPPAPDRGPDVIFVPTPQEIVEKMLELAKVKKGELHYDLGCGDGRIVVTSAKKYGARGVGIDIDPERVKESRENVRRNKVGHLVKIHHADIFEVDFSKADVVTLYLLPDLNVRLMPQLRKLRPGARIVSYQFAMEGAKPDQIVDVMDDEGRMHTIYLWTVPWEAEDPEDRPEKPGKDEGPDL